MCKRWVANRGGGYPLPCRRSIPTFESRSKGEKADPTMDSDPQSSQVADVIDLVGLSHWVSERIFGR